MINTKSWRGYTRYTIKHTSNLPKEEIPRKAKVLKEGEFRHQHRHKVSQRLCVNIDPQVVVLFLSIPVVSLLRFLSVSRRLFAVRAYMLQKLYRDGFTAGKTRVFFQWDSVPLVFQCLNYWTSRLCLYPFYGIRKTSISKSFNASI